MKKKKKQIDIYEIILKYFLGLGLPLSRSILSITRKRLAFDSVTELSYFISMAEKTKKTYNVIPWDACGTPTVKIRFGCTENCKARQ